MTTIPGFRRAQVPQSRFGTFAEQSEIPQYRMNPLAATRPGGCSDVGPLHCSTGESRSSVAKIMSEPFREREPGSCAIERASQLNHQDSWSGFVQRKSSVREVDMSKYFMVPKSYPDGYNGVDVTLNKPSRLLSSLAASAKAEQCGAQLNYRSYSKYA